MQVKALFRHYAGRMPSPARWYLAVAAMLLLVLLGAHFAVQAHVQKIMRQSVYAWLHQAGGTAAEVRYRLLRGALTVNGVRVKRDGWMFKAPRVYLHVSMHVMLSKNARFPMVRLDGVDIALPGHDIMQWSQGAPSSRIMQLTAAIGHARRIMLSHSRVRFLGTKNPWTVRDVSGQFTSDGFDLNGISNGGSLHMHGKASGGVARGTLDWKGMAATDIARSLGLGVALGSASSGLLHWQVEAATRHLDMHGNVQLVDQPGAGAVQIQGETGPEGFKLLAQCHNVFLDGFGEFLPALAGRRLQTGIWNGDLQLSRQGENNQWRMRLDGAVRKAKFVSENSPAWMLGSMTLSGTVVNFSTHRLHADRVQIHDMDITLQADEVWRTDASWPLQAEALEFENVRPVISPGAESGRLALPALKGSGHVDGDGHVQLDAASDDDEAWRIHGEGDPGTLFTVNIQAERVPVVRLRPFLPNLSLPGNAGAPRISGNSRFKIAVKCGSGRVWLAGRAVFSDVALSQGGDTFSAHSVTVDIHKAGMVKTQSLGPVRIDGWHYQAALHPIPKTLENETTLDTAAQRRELPWSVDGIVASHGVISMGSKDAVWARDAFLSLNKLRAGTSSPLKFHAVFGSGNLRMRGRISPFSVVPEITLKARLTSALPFFLNNWLAVSGAPRLLRGRLDGALYIKPAHGKAAYSGQLNLTLHQGRLESGAFPQDPLLSLAGFDMRALSERLSRRGDLKLVIPFAGNWRVRPFSMRALGLAALKAVKRRATSAKPARLDRLSHTVMVSRIRLHKGHVFSHNEHVRLWRLVKTLWKQPKLVAELIPQLGRGTLDAALAARVRHTQEMIEQYMRRRGIIRRRIYPVWPSGEHRAGDASGIKVLVRRPYPLTPKS